MPNEGEIKAKRGALVRVLEIIGLKPTSDTIEHKCENCLTDDARACCKEKKPKGPPDEDYMP